MSTASGGYQDAQGKMHETSDKARAAEGGEQGRAITRGEEAAVRAALDTALGPGVARVGLVGEAVSIRIPGLDAAEMHRQVARAGIVPNGGWWWTGEAARVVTQAPAPPPEWLTTAVLAALPCDGTPVERNGAFHKAIDAAAFKAGEEWTLGSLDAALDAMTGAGEIEYMGGGRWRRWGVPEGWALVPCDDGLDLFCGSDGPGKERATMYADGRWIVWNEGWATGIVCEGLAPTLAAARTAALRACYERGVFGPRPVAVPGPSRQAYDPTRIRERLAALLAKGPRKAVDLLIDVLATGAPEGFALPDLRAQLVAIGARRVYAGSGEQWEVGTVPDPIADVTPAPHFDAPTAPAPTRAEHVRLALLAVLTRGPVVGLSYMLEALSAERVQPAADGRECREAAREIGASVDGARWSLPAMAPGWGWQASARDPRHETVLAPLVAVTGADDDYHVACVLKDSGGGGWGWIVDGGLWTACPTLADGQRQALAAARRAGLFARPAAVEPPAEPEEFIPRQVARVLGLDVERVLVVSDNASDTIERVEVDGLTVHEETLDKLRAAGIKVRAPDPSASPVNPLDALARHLCGVHAYEPGSEGMRVAVASAAELAPLLAAWGAELVGQARASRHAIEAVGEQDGPGVAAIPHATVQASLAARAYAADAPLLYAVWKAAVALRDAAREVYPHSPDGKVQALCAILDAAEREGQTPTDPSARPDLSNAVAMAQLERALADARQELAAAEQRAEEQRERAKRAEREEQVWRQREAESRAHGNEARAKLATLGAEIDALHARWGVSK